ncbi:16S rRNA (guanine(966)-N(2))-methyltransferase RsmD [Demequina sp. NBRC 110051]|uniref:16S rRNA (guanine(966)-N(2))-methyltransferase RsmD n=1 Tax=Demequina sp. NBRC 110051 TaxID=1570340 RepID=UPI000A05B646|nr:16S rRNA (guanine(966)-N(2))-methyltransferase RsmD [Demequina sp. NBRC 110051]
MTRIIAGELGGRRLAVPPKGTRPTTDRVREALFSRLDHADALRGTRVLDIFAGSGALGIEALSRGAVSAVFVEASTAAARVLQQNLRDLGLATRAQVAREKALPYLARAAGEFDLVLIDPPYDLPAAEVDAVLAALPPLLAPDALVVLEGSTRAVVPTWPATLDAYDVKDYGETRLHYADVRPEQPGSVEP